MIFVEIDSVRRVTLRLRFFSSIVSYDCAFTIDHDLCRLLAGQRPRQT